MVFPCLCVLFKLCWSCCYHKNRNNVIILLLTNRWRMTVHSNRWQRGGSVEGERRESRLHRWTRSELKGQCGQGRWRRGLQPYRRSPPAWSDCSLPLTGLARARARARAVWLRGPRVSGSPSFTLQEKNSFKLLGRPGLGSSPIFRTVALLYKGDEGNHRLLVVGFASVHLSLSPLQPQDG
jgi:hypothetical protein